MGSAADAVSGTAQQLTRHPWAGAAARAVAVGSAALRHTAPGRRAVPVGGRVVPHGGRATAAEAGAATRPWLGAAAANDIFAAAGGRVAATSAVPHLLAAPLSDTAVVRLARAATDKPCGTVAPMRRACRRRPAHGAVEEAG